MSQHITHSNQTLGDIWDNLPCDHRALPVEAHVYQTLTEYGVDEASFNGGAICVEEIVYGDGLDTPDYGRSVWSLLLIRTNLLTSAQVD